jgi:hypothetical protein
MDDLIFEEFKGTGNSEIHLDRRIAEKRVFPAININRSGTRREDLLIDPDMLQKIWILRKLLHPMDEMAAMEFMLDKMKASKNNLDFFDMMRRMRGGAAALPRAPGDVICGGMPGLAEIEGAVLNAGMGDREWTVLTGLGTSTYPRLHWVQGIRGSPPRTETNPEPCT